MAKSMSNFLEECRHLTEEKQFFASYKRNHSEHMVPELDHAIAQMADALDDFDLDNVSARAVMRHWEPLMKLLGGQMG